VDLRERLHGNESLAATLLNYQPFILSDDVQTGAAYSWMRGGDPRLAPPLVFNRAEMQPDDWRLAVETNERLRAMYDDMLDEIAHRYPSGSLLDVACNNGYFPVGAELRGMRGFGMDLGDYTPAVELLNRALGTNAQFVHAAYDPRSHILPELQERLLQRTSGRKFDVTVISAIMCHLPDPLHFLAAVGEVTGGAMVYWGQMIESENLIVAYQAPHDPFSTFKDFPHTFNDNTRISFGMFREAARQMGFREIVEIEPRPTWLTPLFAERGLTLEQELAQGENSRHAALMAIR
jgi:hypothetical protein